MKVVVGPYTGAYPSTTTVIGEVAPQFVAEPAEWVEYNQSPPAHNPLAVAIGFAVLIPLVLYGFFFA